MYTVLFADDEPIMRVAFRQMLEASGGRYTLAASASNGAEALAFARANPVDIIVTDLKMPVMDGLELIERLKSDGFSGAILVLSNYNDFELVRTALTQGASDYLLKQSLDAEKLHSQLDILAARLDAHPAAPPAPHAGHAADALEDAYARGGTYRPCLLCLRPANAAQLPPIERVLAVLEQVLGDSSICLCAIAGDRGLLLFPAEDRSPDAARRAQDKLRQCVRGLRTYLNLPVDVLVAPPTASPEEARLYCAACLRLAETPPDPDASAVRSMESLLFSHLPNYPRFRQEVQKTLLFLQFHYAEKLSLDDVARVISLNPSYLCRVFKQETGETMFRHMNNLRMQKAAQLIAEGRTYMRSVAAEVGIDDQFYFARVFKKYHGVSPSEYGKSHRP